MRRRSTTIWASMSLPTGWSKTWRSAPTVMVTLPPWTVTVPIASSSEVTACHSMLWLTGCSKIWRSVFRWRLSRCGDSGEDDIVLPSGSTLPGHVLVVGVDGVRFDVLGPQSAPSVWARARGHDRVGRRRRAGHPAGRPAADHPAGGRRAAGPGRGGRRGQLRI